MVTFVVFVCVSRGNIFERQGRIDICLCAITFYTQYNKCTIVYIAASLFETENFKDII